MRIFSRLISIFSVLARCTESSRRSAPISSIVIPLGEEQNIDKAMTFFSAASSVIYYLLEQREPKWKLSQCTSRTLV
jgi:hypothetical protein